MTGNNERKLPAIAIRFTLRSLLGLMLLVGVYFAGRASIIPTLQAEKDRVTQARHAARTEIEKYEELQRQLQQQILREQLRPFIEAEQHNLRNMREQFEIEIQETER